MYSQALLMPWVRRLREEVSGLELFDAHVHIGLRDPGGLETTEEEALEALGEVGSRALVFPLKEPGGYRDANARILELGRENPDTLRALARLDPSDDALGEAQRCLSAGAVGLKLHPRGEGFELADERLDAVFRLADDARLPIMVHAGAGDADVGPQALERARANPGARLILAHCAIGAFDHVVPRAAQAPNLFFDTSWWNPADVWALLRMVPPGRILYASDVPFAAPATAIVLTGRLALQAGLSAEQVRSIMGGQIDRLVERVEPLELGGVPDEVEPLAPELERLYVTLLTAVEPMLRGEDPGQQLELAKAAAGAPAGPHADVIECVAALLELNERAQTPDPLRPQRTPGFDLVQIAAVAARTPRAALPSLDEIRAHTGAG